MRRVTKGERIVAGTCVGIIIGVVFGLLDALDIVSTYSLTRWVVQFGLNFAAIILVNGLMDAMAQIREAAGLDFNRARLMTWDNETRTLTPFVNCGREGTLNEFDGNPEVYRHGL